MAVNKNELEKLLAASVAPEVAAIKKKAVKEKSAPKEAK